MQRAFWENWVGVCKWIGCKQALLRSPGVGEGRGEGELALASHKFEYLHHRMGCEVMIGWSLIRRWHYVPLGELTHRVTGQTPSNSLAWNLRKNFFTLLWQDDCFQRLNTFKITLWVGYLLVALASLQWTAKGPAVSLYCWTCRGGKICIILASCAKDKFSLVYSCSICNLF